MSRLFDSVFRPSVSSHPGQRNPVQCYNLDIYAPTAQFPGVQSSRLPATNPSFQMARFLKSTGPGPSKLQDNSPNKNKRDRNRYKLMVQLARKAARNIRSEGGSSLKFKPPLVGVVQKISRSGTKYLQIVTPASESDENLSDHDEHDDDKCSTLSSKSIDVEDLKKWIAALNIDGGAHNHSEEILPSQIDRSAIQRLRTSQSLDFELSETPDESKVEISNASSQNFSTPPIQSILGTIRPRSSSLRGPPRMIIMPPDTLSENTLSCTESEERLMESPTLEDFPRTEYITMAYDESHDTLQIAQRTTDVQDMSKGEALSNSSSRKYRAPGREIMSQSIVQPPSSNLREENYIDIIEKEDSENFRHDSASISQFSSDSNITYNYKRRGEQVRQQKIKDLQNSRTQKVTSNYSNNKIVEGEKEEISYIGSGNEYEISSAHHESQVPRSTRKAVMDAREVIKYCDNTSLYLVSHQTDTSPATPKAKDLDMLQGIANYKLIHPAFRTQLGRNNFVEEPALISDMEKAGFADGNTTLPTSTYQRPAQTKDGSSPILTSQLHAQGKNKPLPPIQHLRLKSRSISSETTEAKPKKTEAAPVPIGGEDERRKNLETSHQSTSPVATATAHSFPSSSSPSQADISVPAPFSSPSSSVTASPSPSSVETLEHRVKQLEQEKLLLRTALTAVLNTAGTLQDSSSL